MGKLTTPKTEHMVLTTGHLACESGLTGKFYRGVNMHGVRSLFILEEFLKLKIMNIEVDKETASQSPSRFPSKQRMP